MELLLKIWKLNRKVFVNAEHFERDGVALQEAIQKKAQEEAMLSNAIKEFNGTSLEIVGNLK